MNIIDLEAYGLDQRFVDESKKHPDFYIGRIISQYKNLYKVITEQGEIMAEISGKLRFEAKCSSHYPVVGDFVMMDRDNHVDGYAIIHHVLARRSAFIRKAAGKSMAEQVVAANIDVVFICMALNYDYNLRRLERYLGIAWDSGATPVIVLTKADLCRDLSQKLAEVKTISLGVDVLVTSSVTNEGWKALEEYIAIGKTLAFIGSSGVGKSSLINAVLGKSMLYTQTIRKNEKGMHTTTRRELLLVPQGGVVIDTPGMREIGIESADFMKAFCDIEVIAEHCKFRDCTHASEPGCAVQNAISEGQISAERLANYIKMKKEAKYENLNAKQIETEKLTNMFAEVGGMKKARKFIKDNNKRRRY